MTTHNIALKRSFLQHVDTDHLPTPTKETKAAVWYDLTPVHIGRLRAQADGLAAMRPQEGDAHKRKLAIANINRSGASVLELLSDYAGEEPQVGESAQKAAVDPSQVTYSALVGAFARFNAELFGGRLPPVMLILNRKRNAHGYFHAEQWRGREGGDNVHEIALNPDTMGRTVEEVLSTLVHEMTHHEQQCFGKPSKNGHHNKEWGGYMRAVGLEPRGVGKCAGKDVGRTVSHDIIEGGPFAVLVAEMIAEGLDLSYVTNSFTVDTVKKKKDRSKVKHSCPECDLNVWCKEGSYIMCGDCGVQLEEVL